nr:MAG TPA: hypothetical protein [Caudoviricetes sp.]
MRNYRPSISSLRLRTMTQHRSTQFYQTERLFHLSY